MYLRSPRTTELVRGSSASQKEIPGAIKMSNSERIICDLHCDTLLRLAKGQSLAEDSEKGHLDLPKLKRGGINVQVFACWISPKYLSHQANNKLLKLIDLFYQEIDKNSNEISLATGLEEIQRITTSGKIAAILAIEGGHSLALEGNLANLRNFYRLGVRILTLTWNNSNEIGTAAADKRIRKFGLTPFGQEVIREMNRLGMIIDLSHVSEKTFWNVMKITRKPVIASHSCVKALNEHFRNLSDKQICALAKSGGLIGINFCPGFLSRNRRPSDVESVVEQIDYIKNLVGIDYVAIGSDFDGISKVPRELEDASKIPNLIKTLQKRKYAEEEINKVLAENFLRVLKLNEE